MRASKQGEKCGGVETRSRVHQEEPATWQRPQAQAAAVTKPTKPRPAQVSNATPDNSSHSLLLTTPKQTFHQGYKHQWEETSSAIILDSASNMHEH